MKRLHWGIGALTAAGVIAACAGSDTMAPASGATASKAAGDVGSSRWQFQPLTASAVCTNGGDAVKPFILAAGFEQNAIASEPSFADVPDMNTQNENGKFAGRFVYRVHEVGSNGSLSVTDLETGVTKTIAQRADWESLDGTVWTPWGTLLFAEETNAAGRRDPEYPAAVAGLVYEVSFAADDPSVVVDVKARPAIGSKSHEGMRFDTRGNLYTISERTPGYIFKFVPDTKGDLSNGQTYVMKITNSTGDRVGDAQWIPLDRAAVQIDASAAADAVGATGYGRPEDLEIATSSGSNRGGSNTLYAAITSEHRVLAIDLREDNDETFSVSNYVARGVNVDNEFSMPDNLALNHTGDLYITEDPGGNTASGKRGDDIWVAVAGRGGQSTAAKVSRFATLTDCEAEPTGIYFDIRGQRLFVNVQHRGGDRLDKTMAIEPTRR